MRRFGFSHPNQRSRRGLNHASLDGRVTRFTLRRYEQPYDQVGLGGEYDLSDQVSATQGYGSHRTEGFHPSWGDVQPASPLYDGPYPVYQWDVTPPGPPQDPVREFRTPLDHEPRDKPKKKQVSYELCEMMMAAFDARYSAPEVAATTGAPSISIDPMPDEFAPYMMSVEAFDRQIGRQLEGFISSEPDQPQHDDVQMQFDMFDQQMHPPDLPPIYVPRTVQTTRSLHDARA